MNKTNFDRRQTVKYLLFTFGAAYAIQIGVYFLYKSGIPFVYQLLMAAMMFVPFFGVLISGHTLRDMGWPPVFKGNLRIILFAWLAAISLVAAAVTVSDKIRAKKHSRRVPELTLFALAGLGGSVLMFLTMLLIRHKTKHVKFMLGLPIIMVLQTPVLYLLLTRLP